MAERLWLGGVPSLQDSNRITNPAPGGPTREMQTSEMVLHPGYQQMAQLSNQFGEAIAIDYKDWPITWKLFTGRPQSSASGLTTLYEIEKACHDWFLGMPRDSGKTVGLALNFHSDAGATTSWVAVCYDTRDSRSLAVGRKIAEAVKPIFDIESGGKTAIRTVDYTNYVMATTQAGDPQIALLMEFGNHQCAADNLTLQTRGPLVARAALKAIVEYFGIPAPQPPPPPLDDAMAEVLAFIKAHPELGGDRAGDGLAYVDAVGDVVVKTTSGAWVVRRKFAPASLEGKHQIGVIRFDKREAVTGL